MSLELEQIRVAYETLGMTVEEIALDRELEVEAVKAALMQCSSKYRKACGKEEESEEDLNFNNEQLKRVNEGLFHLAMNADDENLKLKALKYIRDDKKGRKDVVKQLGNVSFNILQFNEAMKSVRQGADNLKSKFLNQGPVTDV